MTWVRIAPEALSDLDDYEIQEPDYGDYYAVSVTPGTSGKTRA